MQNSIRGRLSCISPPEFLLYCREGFSRFPMYGFDQHLEERGVKLLVLWKHTAMDSGIHLLRAKNWISCTGELLETYKRMGVFCPIFRSGRLCGERKLCYFQSCVITT